MRIIYAPIKTRRIENVDNNSVTTAGLRVATAKAVTLYPPNDRDKRERSMFRRNLTQHSVNSMSHPLTHPVLQGTHALSLSLSLSLRDKQKIPFHGSAREYACPLIPTGTQCTSVWPLPMYPSV